MKQTRIRVTCDPCAAWHEVETEEGVETVPVGGQTLDLCPSHKLDLQPFLALVAEWGASATGKQGRQRPIRPGVGSVLVAPMSAPEAPRKGGKQRGGARARKRRQNGAQAPQETTSDATPCPLCQRPMADMSAHLRHVHGTNVAAVYGTTCPLCGEPGRSTHLARAHRLAGGMPAAFVEAQRLGDPHGVIASRAEALAGVSG